MLKAVSCSWFLHKNPCHIDQSSDKSKATQVLLGPLSSSYPSPDADLHPIDIPHTSRLYKTLLQGGHYSMAAHSISRSPSFDAGAFASALVKAAGQENIVKMSLGGGGFVVAELCERLCQEGDILVRKEVASWFDAKVRTEVEKSDVKGKDVLLAKLSVLTDA